MALLRPTYTCRSYKWGLIRHFFSRDLLSKFQTVHFLKFVVVLFLVNFLELFDLGIVYVWQNEGIIC
ncbi:hypothetical protein ES332_D06G110000v1 [Gossypium tomentosum]|uniref:Uncharacterized protein n=1 Tax=Gossypium tomentosum TaxID=34277 RepID=A0A5D2KHF3_GOSTO|nr:hypothetical protein ES332_D06G110000v1 [Gossypium tomentosum]TYH66254.1 hypothetical protein ES332_D06G110000v1 [Gossypium tomentosum]TYH66255.1 hypothetical protein ES332_D06G110000v1 [Gossypium tomentosum]TYH66256.1 hypothetical protein ES332_D06G110000v1 [Gossypium tomentosum]TYH66257.1 hypothetical protein ES332_D06G110000v1 [Gossypium tomentosum]